MCGLLALVIQGCDMSFVRWLWYMWCSRCDCRGVGGGSGRVSHQINRSTARTTEGKAPPNPPIYPKRTPPHLLPGPVGHHERRVADVAADVVDELGVGEGAVPAVVPHDEEAPHEEACVGSGFGGMGTAGIGGERSMVTTELHGCRPTVNPTKTHPRKNTYRNAPARFHQTKSPGRPYSCTLGYT